MKDGLYTKKELRKSCDPEKGAVLQKRAIL